jgi:hypothetical protein
MPYANRYDEAKDVILAYLESCEEAGEEIDPDYIKETFENVEANHPEPEFSCFTEKLKK